MTNAMLKERSIVGISSIHRFEWRLVMVDRFAQGHLRVSSGHTEGAAVAELNWHSDQKRSPCHPRVARPVMDIASSKCLKECLTTGG